MFPALFWQKLGTDFPGSLSGPPWRRARKRRVPGSQEVVWIDSREVFYVLSPVIVILIITHRYSTPLPSTSMENLFDAPSGPISHRDIRAAVAEGIRSVLHNPVLDNDDDGRWRHDERWRTSDGDEGDGDRRQTTINQRRDQQRRAVAGKRALRRRPHDHDGGRRRTTRACGG